MRRLAMLALLLTAAAQTAVSVPESRAHVAQTLLSLPPATNRIRFVVRCIEENRGVKRTLYEADIDGPAGTDFTVHLGDRGFTLDASFVNELTASGKLDVRATLTTRRRQGTSRAGLPLWEEDAQTHRFVVGFDQEIEMLPFGGAGSAGLLKFDIVPERSGGTGPMRIHINDIHSNGAIAVNAFHQPHWYAVETAVVESNSVIARGSARIFAGTQGSLALTGLGNITITPRPLEHADAWRYTDIALSGRMFAPGSRAVICRSEWQSFPIDSKRTLRIRVAPERIEQEKGECS